MFEDCASLGPLKFEALNKVNYVWNICQEKHYAKRRHNHYNLKYYSLNRKSSCFYWSKKFSPHFSLHWTETPDAIFIYQSFRQKALRAKFPFGVAKNNPRKAHSAFTEKYPPYSQTLDFIKIMHGPAKTSKNVPTYPIVWCAACNSTGVKGWSHPLRSYASETQY